MDPKTRALVIFAVALSLGLGGCGPPPLDILTGPDPFDSLRRQENVDGEAAMAHSEKWEQASQLASVQDIEDLGLEKDQELNYRHKRISREDHAELSKLVESLSRGPVSALLIAHSYRVLSVLRAWPCGLLKS